MSHQRLADGGHFEVFEGGFCYLCGAAGKTYSLVQDPSAKLVICDAHAGKLVVAITTSRRPLSKP
jgi:hypothetical protein